MTSTATRHRTGRHGRGACGAARPQGRPGSRSMSRWPRRPSSGRCSNEADPAECVGFFADKALPVAGPGAPLVSEFALMEYAAALGVTTESGFAQVGGILELRYRLPKLWDGCWTGGCRCGGPAGSPRTPSASRGRCRPCRPAPGAGGALVFVGAAGPHGRGGDGAVRPRSRRSEAAGGGREAARRCAGRPGLLRRHRPDRRRGRSRRRPGPRGRAPAGAKQQADLGSTESLDVRRAKALGDLARRQLAFGFEDAEPGRAVDLVVHISEDALTGTETVGRCGNTRSPISVDQIKEWCGSPNTKVTVKPVIDLAEHIHVEAYEAPDRLKDQNALVDVHCVFPHCTKPAMQLRHRPRHRPRRGRPDVLGQHRAVVPTAPPRQDPRRVGLLRPRPRHLPLDVPQRPQADPRPPRHPHSREP